MEKNKKQLTQPLMMRRDYDSDDDGVKEATMMKKIAPIDYDDLIVKRYESQKKKD